MSRPLKRIVIKFGTGILTQPEASTLDRAQIERFSGEVAEIVRSGIECIIVSSGAVGAGLMTLGLSERPKDLAGVQACAAVGQCKLMQLYESAFTAHGLHVAQLPLTHGDLDSRIRSSNVTNTLDRLLSQKGVVPIINENDSVAVEELRFGDNDRLSAEVAMLTEADLLILLTTAEGLLNGSEVVPEVHDIEAALEYAQPTKGKFGTGGMVSKLQAVKAALEAGIPAVIASGRRSRAIAGILSGETIGTRFYPAV